MYPCDILFFYLTPTKALSPLPPLPFHVSIDYSLFLSNSNRSASLPPFRVSIHYSLFLSNSNRGAFGLDEKHLIRLCVKKRFPYYRWCFLASFGRLRKTNRAGLSTVIQIYSFLSPNNPSNYKATTLSTRLCASLLVPKKRNFVAPFPSPPFPFPPMCQSPCTKKVKFCSFHPKTSEIREEFSSKTRFYWHLAKVPSFLRILGKIFQQEEGVVRVALEYKKVSLPLHFLNFGRRGELSTFSCWVNFDDIYGELFGVELSQTFFRA